MVLVSDPTKPLPFVINSVGFGISGLALGVLIDKHFANLTKKYPEKKFLFAFLQFVVLALIIAITYMYLQKEFATHFQVTLTGMVFPAMFFGVQGNLFDVARSAF